MARPPDPARPRGEIVARMFGAIADRYDLMNRVMTMGRDQRWRTQAAEAAQLRPGDSALDVATGTGDLAFLLAERVGSSGRVIGVDFTPEMLRLARLKAAGKAVPVSFQEGDAEDLRFDANSFSAVTCAFGVRNFENRQMGIDEMARVVAPGGRVVILELTPPQNALARGYMKEVVPRLGQLLARARDAYTYLPESAEEFPQPLELGTLMQRAGLRKVTYRLLNFGTVALHWGTKPG
jgi:demethylmenaquinone methyltransferase / 2-methoxy-6-polyprenyl-1,4-benzoquinol methylase